MKDKNWITDFDCGCKVAANPRLRDCMIHYCPTHEAGPDLLEACKAWIRDRSTCPTTNGKDLEAWEAMVKAIARAEGRSET